MNSFISGKYRQRRFQNNSILTFPQFHFLTQANTETLPTSQKDRFITPPPVNLKS